MSLCRLPVPALRGTVALFWATEGDGGRGHDSWQELHLPGGGMSIAIRLGGAPVRIFDGPGDLHGRSLGMAVIGGVRDTACRKAVPPPAASVGLLLQPGAPEPLTGTPAGALAGSHTPLAAVWRRADHAELVERLQAAPDAARRLDLLEAFLLRRLSPPPLPPAVVRHAVARLAAGARVAEAVAESGYSHRHFAALFRTATGLGPKAFCRLARFDRVLELVRAEPGSGWAEIAAAAGYADQAHLSREFRAIAGLSPGRYRRIAPTAPRHVPL